MAMTVFDPVQLNLPSWVNRDRLESQRPVIEEILARFDEGNQVVVLDAPVGQGKSLIANVVWQCLGGSMIYNCNAIVLQDQLEKDFPDAAVIKGKRNYPTLFGEPDHWGNVPNCSDCDWDKKTKLCSHCSNQHGSCPYVVARDEAMFSRFVCTNYAYFLGECNLGQGKFSGRDLVVTDECDQIEQELMNHVTISITSRMQKFIGLSPPEKKTVESAWVEWYEYALERIGAKVKELGRPEELRERRQVNRLKRLYETVKVVRDRPEGFIYTGYDSDTIEFKPVMVDHLGQEYLWRHGRRFLCMSATVVSPEEFIQSLGYDGPWASVFAPSTFPKERRPVYFCPSAVMTKKNEVEEHPKMAEALSVVVDRHPGERVLVHSHSYKLTRYLRDHLLEANPERKVFSYLNTDERDTALRAYEQTDGSILVAPSMQRGVDLKDDLCRVVVVVKVPLAYLGDKQVSTRLYSTAGGQLWYAVLAARTIIQSFGRGMRHENDHFTGYILDSYFSAWSGKWKAGYGHRLFPAWFQEALHMDSDVRFEVMQEVKKRALQSS